MGQGIHALVVFLYKIGIGGSAFANYIKLKSMTIPDGVTSIGERAFRFCTKLMSVTIGENVTSIGIC